MTEATTTRQDPMFVYGADSLDEARKIAESGPMESRRARSFRIRSCLLNVGTFAVRLYSGGGQPTIA